VFVLSSMCLCVKIGMLVEVGDVIIQSNFGFNIFRGFRSYGGGSKFPFSH